MAIPDSPPPMPQTVGSPNPAQGQAVQLQFRDDDANLVYANLSRVGGTPDEAVVEFALHLPSGQPTNAPVADVHTRVVMNYNAAKMLALSLSQVIQKYEQVYGVLELDPRRRMRENRPQGA